MTFSDNLTWAIIGAGIGAVLGLLLTLGADKLLTRRRQRDAARRWAKLGLDYLEADEKVTRGLRNMMKTGVVPSIQGALDDRRWQLLQALFSDVGKGPDKLAELHKYMDLLARFEEAQFKVPAAARADEERLKQHGRLARFSAQETFEGIIAQQPRVHAELEALA